MCCSVFNLQNMNLPEVAAKSKDNQQIFEDVTFKTKQIWSLIMKTEDVDP